MSFDLDEGFGNFLNCTGRKCPFETESSRKKLNLNFPQLSKKLYFVGVKNQLRVIVVPHGERKEKLFEGRETE